MALFVVLAVLTAMLAVPLWQQTHEVSARPTPSATTTPGSASSVPVDATPRPAFITTIWPRAVFGVALLGVGIAAALVFILAMRPRLQADTRPPFATARQEIDTLTQLAKTSVAQGAELSRERDVRRRAEEDAQLKQQLLAQSVEEKIRLGRDLHDGIIQSLYAAGLTLEAVRTLIKTDPSQAEHRLEEIRGALNTAIRDVRSYITGLTPDNLRQASFSRAVTALFEQLRAGREVQFDIQIDDDAAIALDVEQNVEALQIAREAISNALRHGEAKHIALRMHQGGDEVCLLVQDDGRGFHADQGREGGHGLTNMRARAERLGASLRVTSRPGEGARVIATFPLRRSATAETWASPRE